MITSRRRRRRRSRSVGWACPALLHCSTCLLIRRRAAPPPPLPLQCCCPPCSWVTSPPPRCWRCLCPSSAAWCWPPPLSCPSTGRASCRVGWCRGRGVTAHMWLVVVGCRHGRCARLHAARRAANSLHLCVCFHVRAAMGSNLTFQSRNVLSKKFMGNKGESRAARREAREQLHACMRTRMRHTIAVLAHPPLPCRRARTTAATPAVADATPCPSQARPLLPSLPPNHCACRQGQPGQHQPLQHHHRRLLCAAHPHRAPHRGRPLHAPGHDRHGHRWWAMVGGPGVLGGAGGAPGTAGSRGGMLLERPGVGHATPTARTRRPRVPSPRAPAPPPSLPCQIPCWSCSAPSSPASASTPTSRWAGTGYTSLARPPACCWLDGGPPPPPLSCWGGPPSWPSHLLAAPPPIPPPLTRPPLLPAAGLLHDSAARVPRHPLHRQQREARRGHRLLHPGLPQPGGCGGAVRSPVGGWQLKVQPCWWMAGVCSLVVRSTLLVGLPWLAVQNKHAAWRNLLACPHMRRPLGHPMSASACSSNRRRALLLCCAGHAAEPARYRHCAGGRVCLLTGQAQRGQAQGGMSGDAPLRASAAPAASARCAPSCAIRTPASGLCPLPPLDPVPLSAAQPALSLPPSRLSHPIPPHCRTLHTRPPTALHCTAPALPLFPSHSLAPPPPPPPSSQPMQRPQTCRCPQPQLRTSPVVCCAACAAHASAFRSEPASPRVRVSTPSLHPLSVCPPHPTPFCLRSRNCANVWRYEAGREYRCFGRGAAVLWPRSASGARRRRSR